jgi:RNA polymerase sigma-70 factor (ECF subfamily)
MGKGYARAISGGHRRDPAAADDDGFVPPEAVVEDPGDALLAIYDRAVPEVYGYLLPRCPNRTTAEDLTAETFLAAVSAVQRDAVPHMTVAWLVGVARHKLVDHWRRQAREERKLRAVESGTVEAEDPWDRHLDAHRAHDVLGRIAPQFRAALTLRYLDGLSVPEVADLLGRTVTATEALLVRAKAAFRREYDGGDDA